MRAIVLNPLNNCIEVVQLDPEDMKSKKRIEEQIEYCAGCDIADVSYMLCEDAEVNVFRNGGEEPIATI